MPSDDALADLDEAAMDLLRLYELAGVVAVVITLSGKDIYARCQNAADVVLLCEQVIKAHEAPLDRTLN